MNLDAATISASTAALAAFYQIYRQNRADRRQERMEAAAQARDVKLLSIEKHVNDLSDKREAMGLRAGIAEGHAQGVADERADPQTPTGTI